MRIIYTFLLLCISVVGFTQNNLNEAENLYAQGDYEAALAQLTKADIKDPDEYKMKGDCFHKLGDYRTALDYYDKSKLYGYHKLDLYLNRGICKISLNDYEGARLDLVTYMEQNQEDPKVYYWMGVAEYMMLENKASMRFLEQALVLDSAYADAYYLRGANYVEQGKELFALSDFEQAFRLNPGMHRAKMNIAILMLEQENYKGSMELFSELKLESIDFVDEVLYYRGELNFRLHDLEGACADWKESAELGDEDAKSNYKKLCLEKDGKPKFKRRIYAEF